MNLKVLKYLDYIFVLRPVLFPPVWTIALLGYYRNPTLSGNSLILTLLWLTLLVGAVYLLNQVFDLPSDRENKKLFFLTEGHLPVKSAILEIIFLNLVSISGAFLISYQLGILFFLGFGLGLLYSLPPVALKNKPWGGLLTNIAGHGVLTFLIGWQIKSNISWQSLVYSLPYALAVGAVYLNTTLPDREGDKMVGKETLGVKWGIKKTSLLALLLVSVTVIISFWFRDWILFFSSLVSLVFFIYQYRTLRIKDIITASKVSVFSLSVAASIAYPFYLVVLALIFILTRLYYQTRFGIAYPTWRKIAVDKE